MITEVPMASGLALLSLKTMQAAVVVLNKRGWIGYLLPHAKEPKLYCHFHRQEHMDGELQTGTRRRLCLILAAGGFLKPPTCGHHAPDAFRDATQLGNVMRGKPELTYAQFG